MKTLQRADRREHDGKAELAAKPSDRRIDPAHVAQHARPERDRVERHAIAPQRRFGLGPADDVVPVVLVEVRPRLGDDLMQIEKMRLARIAAQNGRLIGVSLLHIGAWRVGEDTEKSTLEHFR